MNKPMSAVEVVVFGLLVGIILSCSVRIIYHQYLMVKAQPAAHSMEAKGELK